MSVSKLLALVVVGGVGLLWPRPAADTGIKVWDASDGKQEPK
jgi:hypothetical protein